MPVPRLGLFLVLWFICGPLQANPFLDDCQTARSAARHAWLGLRSTV